MTIYFILLLTGAAFGAAFVNGDDNLTDDEAQRGWIAGHNKRTSDLTPEQQRRLCGSIPSSDSELSNQPHKVPVRSRLRNAQPIPESYDVREAYGKECPITMDVRDQGSCGSCWAQAAASALSDRICIAQVKNNIPPTNVHLSVQDAVVCGGGGVKNNCNGNAAHAAYSMYVSSGLVSSTCMPYTSGNGSVASNTSTTQCDRSCNPQSGKTYFQDKAYGSTWYYIGNHYADSTNDDATNVTSPLVIEQIQNEILTYGPLTVQVPVYFDFMALYKDGVYEYAGPGSGELLGYHAMKLIGWGTDQALSGHNSDETPRPYWLIVNSWGLGWGKQGTVKWYRGNPEKNLGIENALAAGVPCIGGAKTARFNDTTCDLNGCKGRKWFYYAKQPPNVCTAEYCDCTKHVWNGVKWELSPKTSTCSPGNLRFDPDALACVEPQHIPACSNFGFPTGNYLACSADGPVERLLTTTSTTPSTTTSATTAPTTTTPTTTATTMMATTRPATTTAKPTTKPATTTTTTTAPTPSTWNKLREGEVLHENECLYSTSWKLRACLRSDGNLVIEKRLADGTVATIWASSRANRGNSPRKLTVQKDGKLDLSYSLYNGRQSSATIYSAHSGRRHGNTSLVMQDDGKLVLSDGYKSITLGQPSGKAG